MAKKELEEITTEKTAKGAAAVAPAGKAAPDTTTAAEPQQTAVGTTLLGRSAADLTQEAEPVYSYNWPYDFFSLIELVKLDTAIEYDTE